MSKTRRSLAAAAVVFTLSLMPAAQASAAPRERWSIQQIEPARWIERWGGRVVRTFTSIWQRAGARIDDNGRS